MLIDTHAHLNFREFEEKLNEAVTEAKNNGVTKIICVSSNTKDSQKAIEIAKKYPGVVYAAVGIHPQKTDPDNTASPQKQIKILSRLVQENEVMAIGECGLDYAPPPPGEMERTKEEQYFLFEEQIKLAQKLALPLIVHSRKSFDETIDVLGKYYNKMTMPNGVMHCYAGGKKGISKVIDLGFYCGIDGNVTYDQGLQNVVKEIPFEKLVLETDSPYLSPEPFRNLPNEPSHVKITAKFIAQFLGFSFDEVCKQTTQNAQEVFTKTR